MMPWWVGVLLAIVSYFWLHDVATRPVVIDPVRPNVPLQAIWQGLAFGGQYIVPLLCLLGAVVSFLRRRQRKKLVGVVTHSDASDALNDMSWRQFEMLVAEGFRRQGYHVEETGGGGADGGIDLVLFRPSRNGREKFLVQCKQWRAFKVGVDVVRELYGVMAASGAAGGFVVTSGRFTDEAARFANGRNVTLVDGPKLHGLIRQALDAGASAADRVAPQQPPVSPAAVPAQPRPVPSARATSAPACRACGQPMARRTAKRGANAGREFWGCTDYPACRGTRPIA